ncbi:MAG: M28 family peptidase [Isosphaeraceae bacterium]
MRLVVLAGLPLALLLGVGAWVWKTSEAQTRAQAVALNPAPISGERAYGYLKKLCDIGPRIAGSEANELQRKMVAEHFKKCGARITEQPFNARDPLSGKPVAMTNLVASWFPDRAERLVIAAHYDTRPHPDQETDPARKAMPFLGANDGASGVALLMEIAHHMNDRKTPYGVDLVLLDGEELVYDRVGEFFLGAKEFAKRYRTGQRDRSVTYRYAAGLILDMVGDADLNILPEVNSVKLAPQVVREVFDIASRLKARGFSNQPGPEVLDDHLAFNDARIPTADIIDFDYPAWHTADDLPERCSARSLEEVGRVVTAWIELPNKGKRPPR